MKFYKTDLATVKFTKKKLFRTNNFEGKTAKGYGLIKLDNFYDKKTTEAIMRNIIPLENKLIRANKIIKTLKNEIDSARELWGITINKKNMKIVAMNVAYTHQKGILEIYKRKQKKAWLAFYIATIIYIVGIIIMI